MVGNNTKKIRADYEGEKMFSQNAQNSQLAQIFLKQEDISRVPEMFGQK